MEIGKDKSMSCELIYALKSSEIDYSAFNDTVKEMKKQGYTAKKYEDADGYKGYTFTYELDTIDKVSVDNDVVFYFSGDEGNKMGDDMFKLKKGLFKSTYSAHFIFAKQDDMINDFNEEDNTSNIELDDETNNEMNEFTEELLKDMDYKFSVKLPSKSTNNATKVEEKGKKLTWEINPTTNQTDIEFTFTYYNYTNITVAIVLAGLIVLFILAIIFSNFIKKPQNTYITE